MPTQNTPANPQTSGDQMSSERLSHHLAQNFSHLTGDLIQDAKQEAQHIADPSQCGVVVQKHVDGLVFTLLGVVAAVLALTALGLYLYVRLHR